MKCFRKYFKNSRYAQNVIILLPLSFFLLLGIFLWKGLALKPSELPSTLIGKPAPLFRVTTVEHPGTEVTQSIFNGQVTLLHVWSSYCPSCQKEQIILELLAKKHNISMVGLNYFDDLNSAELWLKSNGNPYQINLFDPQGRLSMDYGVYGTPETFIVDKNGIIRYRQIGPIDEAVWYNILMPILAPLKSAEISSIDTSTEPSAKKSSEQFVFINPERNLKNSGVDIYAFSNPEEKKMFTKITQELRCSVCQNQNLTDSMAPLAISLRQEIYQKVRSGFSEKDIVDFVASRYGEFVLYRPLLSGCTAILWFGPFFLLLMSCLFFRKYLRPLKRYNIE